MQDGGVTFVKLGRPGGPAITSTVTRYALIGYCLLAITTILALRVPVTVFRPDFG